MSKTEFATISVVSREESLRKTIQDSIAEIDSRMWSTMTAIHDIAYSLCGIAGAASPDQIVDIMRAHERVRRLRSDLLRLLGQFQNY